MQRLAGTADSSEWGPVGRRPGWRRDRFTFRAKVVAAGRSDPARASGGESRQAVMALVRNCTNSMSSVYQLGFRPWNSCRRFLPEDSTTSIRSRASSRDSLVKRFLHRPHRDSTVRGGRAGVRVMNRMRRLLFADGACVHAGAAEADLGAAADRGGEHALEVVVAVWRRLAGERAADRVGVQGRRALLRRRVWRASG